MEGVKENIENELKKLNIQGDDEEIKDMFLDFLNENMIQFLNDAITSERLYSELEDMLKNGIMLKNNKELDDLHKWMCSYKERKIKKTQMKAQIIISKPGAVHVKKEEGTVYNKKNENATQDIHRNERNSE